jgi:hypothetical protein
MLLLQVHCCRGLARCGLVQEGGCLPIPHGNECYRKSLGPNPCFSMQVLSCVMGMTAVYIL